VRFHRWGRIGYVGRTDWEHHVFPAFGRPDCFRTLCGFRVGGITRAEKGDMQNKCEACAGLVPEAEERAGREEDHHGVQDHEKAR